MLFTTYEGSGPRATCYRLCFGAPSLVSSCQGCRVALMLEPIKSTNIRLTRMYPRVIKHPHVVSEQSGRMNRRDNRSCSSSMLASTKNYQRNRCSKTAMHFERRLAVR